MEVAILGPLEVRHDDRAIRLAGARARTLVLALVVAHSRPLPGARLVELLWGADPPSRPDNAVQAQVSRLRRTLESADLTDRLVTLPGGYALRLRDDEVDAWRFSAAVTRAGGLLDGGDAAAAETVLADAVAAWRGVALADAGDAPFAVAERRRLDDLHAIACARLAAARLALGRPVDALADLREATTRHPRHEGLHVQLMTALYRAGRAAEALAVYADLRGRLDDVGLAPGPAIEQAQREILRHEVADPPPPPQPEPPPRPTPPATPPSSFVGRDVELGRLDELVATTRLITLVGPGGSGKTRLALEMAARSGARFPDGRVVVELAAVTDPADVGPALSTALRMPPPLDTRGGGLGAQPAAIDRVRAFLRERRCLLVLDNCEHLVDAAAALARDLTASCPGLVVLATSREALHVDGEHLLAVAPLAVPPPDETDPALLARSPAVRLFLDRARALDDRVAFDGRSATAIATICRRLDGLPLALELAAARIRVLTVEQIAARLDDRFRLLTGGARTALPRQRTLEAVVAWSYDLLDARERAAFEALTVFAGGAPVDAVEVVCGTRPEVGADALDALAALVDKSLVATEDDVGGAGDTRAATGRRFVLLETLRDYGRRRLADTTAADAVRTAHARWYAELANTAADGLRGAGQVGWLARLERERDNLTVAFTWLRATDPPAALRLASDLAWWSALRGEPTLGAARLEQVVNDPAVAAPPPDDADARRARAAALSWLAFLLATGSDARGMEHIATLADEAAALLDDDPPDATGGRALALVAFLRARTDRDQALADLARATRSGDRWVHAVVAMLGDMLDLPVEAPSSAFDAFAELGDGWGMVQTLNVRAQIAAAHGRFDDAARDLAHATDLASARDLPELALGTRAQLATLQMLLGDHDRARDLHHEVLAAATARGLDDVVALSEFGLGLLARRDGDLDAAERHHRASLARYGRDGDAPGPASAGIALALCHLCFCAAERGEAPRAYELAARARPHVDASPEPRDRALLAEAVGAADLAAGDPERALRRVAWAAQLRRSLGMPMPPEEAVDVDRIVADARAVLGSVAADAAAAAGERLDGGDALDVPAPH